MRTTVLLVATLLVAGMGLATADDYRGEARAWREKADAGLLQAFDTGQPVLTVELQGPRVLIPIGDFADRAEAKAYYESQTATFFAEVRDLAARIGATERASILYANALFLDVPNGALPALVGMDGVRRASFDWMGATFILPEATGPGVTVNLDQTIAKVQAQDLWALGYRGEGIKLAGIDTGMRPTHEMLKNADGTTRVIAWHDTTEPPSGRCASACDTQGHGTHTITTAAGSNLFNPSSPQGVAPRVSLIGVRIFQGGGGSWEDAQEGLQAAFDLGADITTNSWGGSCGSPGSGGYVTAELAEDLQALGMQNVFAAGNSGAGGVICPGMVDNVVTVAAIGINEVIAGFSSRGPCVWPSGGNSRICPDVSAVGVDVNAGAPCSSYPCSPSNSNCDNCYFAISGTSMATPHVAGVNVLLEQAYRAERDPAGLNGAGKQAEILMRYSAKDLGNPGPDNDYGWGLAKAKAARDLWGAGSGLNLQHLFNVGKPVLRAYETNGITLGVVNLGSVPVTGTFTLEVRQLDTGSCPPTCEVITRTSGAALSPFTEAEIRYAFVGADHAAGNYLVNARYDYTHEGGSGMISETGSFLLKKVHFVKTRVVDGAATTGELILPGGITLRNIGNENAMSVRFEERFDAEGFLPVPAVPPGTGQFGAFANPAPEQVSNPVLNPPELRYVWTTIGTIAKDGGSWSANYNFLAGQPGTYNTRGTLRYSDEAGMFFTENVNQLTVVSPPV